MKILETVPYLFCHSNYGFSSYVSTTQLFSLEPQKFPIILVLFLMVFLFFFGGSGGTGRWCCFCNENEEVAQHPPYGLKAKS